MIEQSDRGVEVDNLRSLIESRIIDQLKLKTEDVRIVCYVKKSLER